MNLKRIFLLTALALGAATLSPAQIYPQEELHFRAPAVPKQIIFAVTPYGSTGATSTKGWTGS